MGSTNQNVLGYEESMFAFVAWIFGHEQREIGHFQLHADKKTHH